MSKADIPCGVLAAEGRWLYHYRYDFDRDGADEWVMENSNLRLIVSPESGGKALALVDKIVGRRIWRRVWDCFGIIFHLRTNLAAGNELRARGRYGLFNRSYIAEWAESQTKAPILKLHYEAPDVLPGGASIEKSIHLEEAERGSRGL